MSGAGRIDLFVDLDELAQVESALRSLVGELVAVDGSAGIAGRADLAGSGDVADALRRFDARWAIGRRRATERLQRVLQLAGHAIEEYRDVEDAVRTAVAAGRTVVESPGGGRP